ncbi:exocyst complex component Sec3 [Tubulinosema ratisbonensis]|uniref:Exocyst complex component Sec3 n=1 Tax=Tubulinosema ratisbonensis TaxID=291195 RepID=A0A437APP0_9MICR|nr:exocyst complex component Sec3 [Tubulinosema ratisbonensis]
MILFNLLKLYTFNKKIISEKAQESYTFNKKIIEELKPTIHLIKKEHLNTKETCEEYNKKLSLLSQELIFIEEKNKELQNEISFLTNLFDHLRKIVVNLEIQNESFEVFQNENLEDLDIIARIESGLESVHDFDSVYKIRVIEERKEEIDRTLKGFFKRFYLFYREKIGKIESTSKGELKIHTFFYNQTKIYEKIIQFASINLSEMFIQIITAYKEINTKIYKKEFENHLKLIYKVFAEKRSSKAEEIFQIFFESFFLVIKAEVHFCSNHLLFDKVDVAEFVSDIFYDVVDFLLHSLNALFEKMPLDLINVLHLKNYKKEGKEGFIWKEVCDKLTQQRKVYEDRFILEESDNFFSRNRDRNLELTLSNLKKKMTNNLRTKLIQIELKDILREENDIFDRLKVLKLLYKFNDEIKDDQISLKIQEKLRGLEKEIIVYVYEDDDKKRRRVERLIRNSKDETRIREFVLLVVKENCDDLFGKEIDEIVKNVK